MKDTLQQKIDRFKYEQKAKKAFALLFLVGLTTTVTACGDQVDGAPCTYGNNKPGRIVRTTPTTSVCKAI